MWTAGHSTRSAEDFLALLAAHGIEHVADVRRFPASRRHPHFAGTPLEALLAASGVRYTWLESLGGRRSPRPDSRNTAWRNAGFRGYADYMATPEFATGYTELLGAATAMRTLIMCAEALWWRCHRSLISDLLRSQSVTVLHITGPGAAVEHPYTAAARLENGTLTYDPTRGEPAQLHQSAPQTSLL